MPRDSQSPALLVLGTTSMLHTNWLTEANEITPLGIEIWHRMTRHFSIKAIKVQYPATFFMIKMQKKMLGVIHNH